MFIPIYLLVILYVVAALVTGMLLNLLMDNCNVIKPKYSITVYSVCFPLVWIALVITLIWVLCESD